MKALSLWQPWATAVALGWKRYETRSWSTSHRGMLAIHASARRPVTDIRVGLEDLLLGRFGPDWADRLPTGAIVATSVLVGCARTEDLRVERLERAMGDWRPGRVAWELADVCPLREPMSWRGRQRLFDVPDELLSRAAAP